MRLRLAFALLPILGCDGRDRTCIDIGCLANLTLTVEPAADLSAASGRFEVGKGDFQVGGPGCEVGSDGTIRLDLGWDDVTEPVDVTWSLDVPAADTGAALHGEGTFRPDWERGEYQDDECLPGCWFGTGTIQVGAAE